MEAKDKLDKLVERAEELLTVLKFVAEDLKQLSDSLKPFVQQSAQQPAQPAPQATPSEGSRTVESVRGKFPEDLLKLLDFEKREGFIMIKPKGILGSDNFARIAEIVRGLGGEYISAGRESHFRVPSAGL